MISFRSFIATAFIIVIALSCTNKTISKERKLYNGIDCQILNIVDSIRTRAQESPFITVWFTMANDTDCVIRFLNTLIVPGPTPFPDSIKETLISKDKDFRGYKKYNSSCLIFLKNEYNNYFDSFVKKDSLSYDEAPFSDWTSGKRRFHPEIETFERIYLIKKDGGLIFLKEKPLQ